MLPGEYFVSAAQQFEAAASQTAIGSVRFLVAGHSLRFVFASDRLERAYTPAFAHLRLPENESARTASDMTIHFWEGYDHPVPPPFAGGVIPSFRGSTVEHLCGEQIKTITVPHTGMVATFDFDRGEAYAWIGDGGAVPAWEFFSPMRTLMNLWLVTKGCQMIHGGAVARDGRGIILTGPSGAGKSTTSLLCYQAGFDFISDDYCIAEIREDRPTRLHSLYRSARMLPSHCNKLNDLVANGDHTKTEDGKASFLLDLKASNYDSSVALKALLLPQVTNEEKSRIVPCGSPLKTWKYVAPSTLAALFGGGADSFQLVTSLVKKTPAFELLLGRDPDDLTAKIGEFLERDFSEDPQLTSVA